MIIYDSAAIYIEIATTLKDKIAKIDAVITALETSALTAAGKGAIQEYSLDDGQTKIRTVYRNAKEVADSISAFETIRQRYINQLNGRMTRLVDSKNFTNRMYGR